MRDIPVFPFMIPEGGVVIRIFGDMILLKSGLGLGNSLGFCAGPRLQVCKPFSISSKLHAGLKCCAHTHTHTHQCPKQQQQPQQQQQQQSFGSCVTFSLC